MATDEIRHFLKTVCKAVEYQNRKTANSVEISPDFEITTIGKHIALFSVPEIDEGHFLHFHVFIRALNIDPSEFLTKLIKRYNATQKTEISLPYLEKPECLDAVSVYSLKLGRRDTLLFSSGSLPRYIFTAGRYFIGHKINDLRASSLSEYLLARDEHRAELIVGNFYSGEYVLN